MKKTYLIGCAVSGIIHMPLLDEKELTSYLIASLFWPIPLTLAALYVHYSLWGNYKHKKKFPVQNKLAEREAYDKCK